MSQADQPGTETKRNYRSTLNLPQTNFPMRANLVQNEPASMKRWAKINLYERVREARRDPAAPGNRGPWPVHDGPPYANAPLHLGHLLNRVVKDLVVRTRTMAGYDAPYVPGWDCHGLPIEHKVLTELFQGEKSAKLESLEPDQRRMVVRRECRKSAEKWLKHQMGQMLRLLTFADFDHPYATMTPDYEAGVLEVLAFMVGQGLVYRQLKPVHWSIDNRTALAEAELEYYDRKDPSIYVRFPVADVAKLLQAFGLTGKDPAEFADLQPSLMIWTTTPWTLPANLAVAVHPDHTYVLAMLGGKPAVVAEKLYATVKALEDKGASTFGSGVLGSCRGRDLVGLTYRHPFVDRESPVVPADYVTLEDGTGLVHTAPGHGLEDWQTGLAHGLDVYCPVREDGTYDDTVPEWLRGKSIWDANPLVVQRLRDSGHLYHHHEFTHSYPHDWRGKTPVIFRATEQWFIAVDKPTKRDGRSLRDMALQAAGRDVKFFPEWGRNRMRGMLESRPDWCISRQRAWGLPIPAFRTPDGNVFLTEALVHAIAEVVHEKGSDVWFTGSVSDLLARYDPAKDPDAPANLDVSRLEKMHDILDVWFESGSSWNPVMRGRHLGLPANLYIEGSDQHRGWFQASLLCCLGALGHPPFRGLLTHGFMVDKDGRKMSKSLGNTLEVDDLLRDFGADVCRWWVASLNYENDIKVDRSYFEVAGESYRKVRNTLRFLLSNLYDFDPAAHAVDWSSVPAASLDAWVLGEYNRLAAQVTRAYDVYDYKAAHAALYNFCNDTLSAIYLAATKDRLYCDRPDSPRRRRTQTVMWHLVDALTRLLAPILPHTADEAYRALRRAEHDDQTTVHTQVYIEAFDVPVDPDWPEAMNRRDAALQALERARAAGVVENPLDAGMNVSDPDGLLRRLAERVASYGEDFHVDFADLLGVSRVAFVDGESLVQSLLDQPRCERSWKRDATVKQRADGGWLTDRDAEAVGVA